MPLEVCAEWGGSWAVSMWVWGGAAHAPSLGMSVRSEWAGRAVQSEPVGALGTSRVSVQGHLLPCRVGPAPSGQEELDWRFHGSEGPAPAAAAQCLSIRGESM